MDQLFLQLYKNKWYELTAVYNRTTHIKHQIPTANIQLMTVSTAVKALTLNFLRIYLHLFQIMTISEQFDSVGFNKRDASWHLFPDPFWLFISFFFFWTCQNRLKKIVNIWALCQNLSQNLALGKHFWPRYSSIFPYFWSNFYLLLSIWINFDQFACHLSSHLSKF